MQSFVITPKPAAICFQCGSKLIVAKKKIKKPTNEYSSKIVETIYKCTNKVCQKQKDVEAKRIKKEIKERQEKADAKKNQIHL